MKLNTLLLCALSTAAPQTANSEEIASDASVPPLVLARLGTHALLDDEALRDGLPKLVNYWASWCAPCRAEQPLLEQLAKQGVTIYGVNYKDKPEAALKFLTELGNPYAGIGQDDTGRMALYWGVYGIPETYLIDGDGVILMRHAGPITQRVLDGPFGEAMNKAGMP